jgi:hypothetical protein
MRKVQDVILRSMAKKITSWQAKTDTRRQAELLRLLLATLASDKLTDSPCTGRNMLYRHLNLFNL